MSDLKIQAKDCVSCVEPYESCDVINCLREEIVQLQSELSAVYDNRVEICKDLADKKAEIERLMEEKGRTQIDLDHYHEIWKEKLEENYRLQKQVNELKEQRDVFKRLFEACNKSSITTEDIINTMNSFYREQAEHLAELKIQQAVKDTAKEILEQVRFLIEERNCVGGYDLEDETIDGTIFVEVLNELKERYGVEVE